MLSKIKIKKYFNNLLKNMWTIAHTKKYLNKKAITLIELIIVMTILSLISIVWVYFYTWSILDSRDAYRITQLNNVYNSMMYFKNNEELPLPDNYIEIRVGGSTIAYQWYIWENVLKNISYRWKSYSTNDPKDWKYYSYYLTKDKKYFQLMSFLENKSNTEVWYITKTNASYEDRFPYVVWNKLWILTESWTNIPIQELINIKEQWFIDFTWSFVWNYNLNITKHFLYNSGDSVIIWNKLVELAKINNFKLLAYWTWETCWWEITDINAVPTAITQISTINWYRSDTPDVCTWNCKLWYVWSDITWKCEPDCTTLQVINWGSYSNNIAVSWSISWENAWSWIIDWQLWSVPWDTWNDELRIDWFYHPYRFFWKVFFWNIWWVSFDSIWTDQARLCKYNDDVYMLKWSAWSQNAWWINFEWNWNINLLNNFDTNVYYKKSDWRFYWYAWSQSVWWIDVNNLNLVLQ